MPQHPIRLYTAEIRILYEIVLYQQTTKIGLMVGEAALMLERNERSGVLRSMHVTLLSIFNAAGEEVYDQVIKNIPIKQRLEAAAIDQYYHPPAEPVVLPKRIVEW